MSALTPRPPAGRARTIALLLVSALLLLAATYGYYRAEIGRIRKLKHEEIAAIGGLKAEQIVNWREERLGDVRRPAESPFFRRALVDWQRSGFAESLKGQWEERLEQERKGGFADAIIFDADGHAVLSASGDRGPMQPATLRAVNDAVSLREAVLSEIYRAADGRVYVDAAAPVLDPSGTPVAVMVQRNDAEAFLFPLVDFWPTPSSSARTSLVHREADEAVVLSDSRGRPGSALTERYPLAQAGRPAVQAVLGRRGIFEGDDAGGTAVLADARPIQGSGWVQVVTVDTSEILAEARFRAGTISLAGASLVLLAAAVVAWAYRQRQARLYRDLYESERQQRETHEEFRTALYSIGDGVITTDREGMIRRMNPVAERLTGWQEADARGQRLDSVFRIIHEETRAPLESPVSLVLRQGKTVGLANHTVLIARDGTERPIADSGAPILLADGTVGGTVLVFSDQTAQRAARNSLRESEERLRLALQAASQGLYDLNVQTGEAIVSPEYASMLGYEPATFVETDAAWRERLHPDDRESVTRAYEDYLAGRRDDYRIEFRQRTRDGGWKWVLSLGKLVEWDAAGRPLRMLGTHTDVTERKRAEAELRVSEGRYRALTEHLPAVVYMALPDADGSTVYVSPRIEPLLGYSPEQWMSEPDLWVRLVHPDDRGRVLAALARSQARHEPFACEYRIADRNGRTLWMRDEANLVQFAPEESPVVLGVMADITARKQAEDTLRESEERYRTVSRLSSDFAYSCVDDGSGRLVVDWITEAFFSLTGFTRADLDEQRCWMFVVHPDDCAGAAEPLPSLRPGDEDSREFRILTKDGQVRWFANRLECTADASAPGRRRIFGAVRDVTERRLAEELREKMEARLRQSQKMEAVGQLAGGVAHDFNNMLQAIHGYAEITLRSLRAEDPVGADVEEIRKAAMRSADLTRQLLAFARKQTIAPQVLDLNATIASILKMLRRLIGEGIDLLWKPAAGLPTVKMDPGQIDQILANLVVNSRDAIGGVGRITIETAATEVDEAYCRDHAGLVPGRYVVLAVDDDGSGMDKETLARLFEPFFTTKPLGQGTGLGLSTVYGIVKQNDGFIDVSSEPGRGTTITIYLPASPATEAGARDTEAAPGPQTGTETILLVEDEGALLKLSTRLLEQLGYTVLPAGDPAAAIERARAHGKAIDLLVTDVVMPEMSGRELWQRLNALQPGLPCLYTSGYTADVIAHHGVLHEGVHFLQKPFTRDALARKVREALSGS